MATSALVLFAGNLTLRKVSTGSIGYRRTRRKPRTREELSLDALEFNGGGLNPRLLSPCGISAAIHVNLLRRGNEVGAGEWAWIERTGRGRALEGRGRGASHALPTSP
jgi:hypothetical protein